MASNTSTADTPRARDLGAQLREARTAAELTQQGVAKLMPPRSKSHVSRWESGQLVPSEADLAVLLMHYNVTGERRERLLAIRTDADDPNWVTEAGDQQAALAEYERTSAAIYDVEPQLIPGLLQRPRYAEELLRAFGVTAAEAQKRTLMRIGRQHVLTDNPPRQLTAVIGEFALRYSPCSADVQIEQLQHLLKMATQDNVTIQILPLVTPSTPALCGPYVVIEFDSAKPIVHLENFGSAVTITDRKTVDKYHQGVQTLRGEAMSPEESSGLIADVINEMENLRNESTP